MESKTAEELRKLDTIIFDMYENDEINDKQYMEIHGQIINVRLAVKDLIIPSVTNCYYLTEEQKKKIDKHKANEIKFSHSSGIGVSVEIKTKKGKWKDITDYSCW